MNIPDDLTELDQWVLWGYREVEGRMTKQPFQSNSSLAKTNDPATWVDYATATAVWQARQKEFDGIGYVFSTDDPYCGIDLDDCLDSGGNLKKWAQPIMAGFLDTYAEISPSGTGIKIWTKAKLPGSGCARKQDDGAIEMYDHGRYFTVTGRIFNGAPLQVEDHQSDVEKLHALITEAKKASGVHSVPGVIPKGVQHLTLLSFAGQLRRMGLSPAEIFPSLMAVNQTRCEDPGPEANIRRMAESMEQYQPGVGALSTVANRLWALTRKHEVAHQEKQDKLHVDTVDGLAIHRAPVAEQNVVVQDLLFHGLTLFAGRQKLGKSWITLRLALCVSQGIPFWGYPVKRPGLVLYAALEEKQPRTTRRINKLQPKENVLLQNISVIYRLLPLMGGGKEQLDEAIKSKSPNLVILDTWTAIVGGGNTPGNVFRSEYAEMNVLHDLAERHDTAIVVVHHTNKTLGAKGLLAVAGSGGLTAAADSVWVMEREDVGICSLEMTGRDAEDQTLAIRFVSDPERFGWELMGTGAEVKDRKDDKEIYTLLREEGALSPARVASLLKMNANRVRTIMYAMHQRGALARTSSGQFSLSTTGDWSDK